MGQCFLYGNGGGKDRYRVKVFGGTSAPANPKESYIWIRTSVPVSGYEINGWTSSLPSWQMGNGFVYIYGEPAYDENKVINLIEDKGNVLNFNFKMCMQQQGTNWYTMDAFVYRRGSWMQFASSWNGELFDNGNQYTNVTGGWVGNGISSTTVGTNLSLIVANSSPYLTTQNAIDLSGYTKLHMIADGNAGQYSYFGISSNVPSNARPNYIASATFSGGENVLDVSAINSGHISIGATASWGVTINISKVWLE